MARQNRAAGTNDSNDQNLENLGTENTGAENTGAEAGSTEAAAVEAKITWEGKEYTKAELEQLIKDQDEAKKKMKAALKGEKVTTTKEAKGVMVAFRNKAGELIVGKGVMYYVARSGGKLHYKEASAVSFLPEGWKDGDAIPPTQGELEAQKTAETKA